MDSRKLVVRTKIVNFYLIAGRDIYVECVVKQDIDGLLRNGAQWIRIELTMAQIATYSPVSKRGHLDKIFGSIMS